MATLQGVVLIAGLAKNGATVKLYSSAQVGSPPAKNTALPASAALQTVTSGTSHGGDGAYRFTGVSAGVYYVAASYNGALIWDSFDVLNPTNARSVKDYGAVGDGLTNDTTAVQAALNDTAYGIITLPQGTYLCGNLTLANRSNFILEGQGGVLLWTGTAGAGDQIGLQLTGVSSNITIRNVEFLGDGVAANGHAGVWWKNAASVASLRVHDCWFRSLVRGVSGIRTASGTWNDLTIESNFFDALVGTGASQGEGVHFQTNASTTIAALIRGNTFSQLQHYGVHLSQGIGCRIEGNRFLSHRTAVATTAVVAAVRVNRFRDAQIVGNTFDSGSDGCIELTPTAGTSLRNVTIEGNLMAAAANAISEIVVGTTDPATDGTPEEVQILGNTIYRGTPRDATLLDIRSGLRVAIRDNLLTHLSVSTARAMINLQGLGDSGGTRLYTDDLEIEANTLYATTSGGSVPAFILQSALCTSNARLAFRHNRLNTTSSFSVGATVTTPTLVVEGQPADGLTLAAALSTVFSVLKSNPLELYGPIAPAITSVSADTTLGDRHSTVRVSASGAARTITLPAAATVSGRIYTILKDDSSTNTVTIDGNAAETIDGQATIALTFQWETVVIQSDGANWIVRARGTDLGREAYKTLGNGTFTLAVEDKNVLVDTTAGATTLNLPASSGLRGKVYTITNQTGTNVITIDPSGAENIDGAATQTIAAVARAFRKIICEGGTWQTIENRNA